MYCISMTLRKSHKYSIHLNDEVKIHKRKKHFIRISFIFPFGKSFHINSYTHTQRERVCESMYLMQQSTENKLKMLLKSIGKSFCVYTNSQMFSSLRTVIKPVLWLWSFCCCCSYSFCCCCCCCSYSCSTTDYWFLPKLNILSRMLFFNGLFFMYHTPFLELFNALCICTLK